MKRWEEDYPTGFETFSYSVRFERVIETAAKKYGRGVVILIDEYDKPILQAIDLVKLLQRHDWNLAQLEFTNISEKELNSVDSESSNPIPVIYQSGYLTIKGYDARFKQYRLGFPNEEVEEGFIDYLAPFLRRSHRFADKDS